MTNTTLDLEEDWDKPRSGFWPWVFGDNERLGDAWLWFGSLVFLLPRIWLAIPFFNAGWTRINNWGSQEWLFNNIHPVPGLPGSIAAPITTAGELILPVLLILGLFGRFAGLGLAVMAFVIFYIVGSTEVAQQNNIPNAQEQVPWMIVGVILFITGPGRISVDYAIRKLMLRG